MLLNRIARLCCPVNRKSALAVSALAAALFFQAASASGAENTGPGNVPCRKARRLADRLGRSVVNVQVVGKGPSGNAVSLASFSGFFWQPEEGKNPRDSKRWIVGCCPGLQALLKTKTNRMIVTCDNLVQRTAVFWAADPATGLCLLTCKEVGKELPSLKLEPVCSLRRGLCVLTVANPSGVDHSARYGFTVGPVLAGCYGKCLAYKLDLDYVRGHEGGIVYAFDRGFAGVLLAAANRGTDAFLGGALAESRPVPAVVLPAAAVQRIARSLKERRAVERGWVGLQLSVSSGGNGKLVIHVKSVAAGSPAQQAALSPGDRILSVRGRKLVSLDDLYELGLWVEYEGVGKELVFEVASPDGAPRTATVRISSEPNPAQNLPR